MENDRRNVVLWVVVALIVMAGVAAVVVRDRTRDRELPRQMVEEPVAGRVSEGVETRSVILFFAAGNSDGLVREFREIIAGGGVAAEAKRTVIALARGPLANGAPAIPRETTVEGVFLDSEGCLYLDLGRELRAFHWGGVSGEWMTISSILRTLGASFPEIRSVRFLEEGHPMETLTGHLDLTRRLWVDDWR
ncbi:MAG: GerMN domain-containing protein [Candidatus Eisenbacteria sp.]|nr:GerMN domain-containing protein [Candidatus Eisenbacteria bacterium]